jgi:hypothetical protein
MPDVGAAKFTRLLHTKDTNKHNQALIVQESHTHFEAQKNGLEEERMK